MKPVRVLAAATALALFSAPLAAQQQAVQERLDMAALARIREEGLNHSYLDSLAQQLMDGIGQRLTASPSLRRAQDWAVQTLRGWGLVNVRSEPWDSTFGRGWERVSYSARWIEPYVQPLYGMPLAWSGSTRGTVTCPVKVVELNDTTALARYEGQLRGSCALILRAPLRALPPEWTAAAQRIDADSILAWSGRPLPQPAGARPQTPEALARMQSFRAQAQRLNEWIARQGLVATFSASPWNFGLILGSAGPQAAQARDSANFEPLPTIAVSYEQAGQMVRDLQRGVNVRVELNVQNRFSNPDKREYNVIGEIPGTDLANQVVMIGGHFDSWYGGTGATDNGAGSIVMMEAMRILKTLNLPLRRTVRIGLWSGEEQGLLGSRAWVRQHRGELDNMSAYLNVDNGTGRLRGVYAQGNAAVMPIFDELLAPFHDLGAVASIPNNTGGTDNLSFDAAGVPGFQFIQDPIDYGTRTHHSQVDTYERLQMDDLRQAATIVAWTVYEIANRDQMMPRKAQTAALGN